MKSAVGSESSHKDILNPNGVSFDLNTSWRVCSVIEREKKGSSMLTGLLSGLKWINWLNTHGGWSETTPSPPFNYLWSLPPTLRYSETSGYISPLWKLVPLPLPPFAPRETALSQVSLRIRKPHWGIFRRILHVTAISIARSNIKIPGRIFEWKLSYGLRYDLVAILMEYVWNLR